MITICVPIFNEEENVERIIENIKETDLWEEEKEKEIILCINGSTDRSWEIASRLAQKDIHLKLIRVNIKSKNYAWELLRDKSSPKSDVLFFVDADVLLEKKTFTRLRDELEKNPRAVVAGAQAIPLPEKGWFSFHRKFAQRAISDEPERKEPFLAGACYAIRRKNASTVRMPRDTRISDDLYLEAVFHKRFSFVPSARFHYRIPSFFDYKRQRVRYWASIKLLREKYPKLAEIIYARNAPQRHSRNLDEMKRRGYVVSLVGYPLSRLNRWMAARALKKALEKGTDTWTPIASSKRVPGARKKRKTTA